MSGVYSKRVSTVVSTFKSNVSVSSTTSPVRKSTNFRQLELSPFALKLENDIPQWTSQTENIFRTTKSSMLDKANQNTGIVWKQTRVTVDYNDLGKVSSSSPATNRRERTAMHIPLQESDQSGNVSKNKPGAVRNVALVKRAGRSKRSKHTNTKLTAAKALLSDIASISSAKEITNKRTKTRGSVKKLVKQKPLFDKTKSPTNKISLSSPVRSARNNYSLLSYEQVGSSGKGKQTKVAKISKIRKSGQKSTTKMSVVSKSTKKDGLEHNTVVESAPASGLRNRSTQKKSSQVKASGKVKAADNSPKVEKTVKKVRNKKAKQIKLRPSKKSRLTYKSTFSSSIALKNGKASGKDLNSKNASPLNLQVHRSNFVKDKAEAAKVPQLRKSKTRKHGFAYGTQKGSIKQVGKKPKQIKTAGNSQTENSQTPKSSLTKSSKLRSFGLQTVPPVKSGITKSGLGKNYLDYSVTSVEEIQDFVGTNNLDKIQKSTTKTGNNTNRKVLLLLPSPKLTNSRRKLVGSPKLLSSAKSTTRSKSSRNLQLLNLSTSVRKDTKDVRVNENMENIDNLERSSKIGKDAKKDTQLLPRKKERNISDLDKSGSKKSVCRSLKTSISPLKKKGVVNVRKTEFVSGLDIPVVMLKRPLSDATDSSPRKKSRFSSSSLLKCSHSCAPKLQTKQSQKSITQSSKSVPKILSKRKHTKLKKLKKDLKNMGTLPQRKSSSLYTSPTKNASNQSFVNVFTRSLEAESLSQKTTPGLAVGKKVFSSPTRKGVSKPSTISRQKKSLTSAKKKSSRHSVALQVKKSLSPANKLFSGLSHKSGETENGQKKKTGSLSTVHSTKAVSLLYGQQSKHSTRKKKITLTSAGVKIEKTSPSKFLLKNNSRKPSSSLKVGKHLTSQSAKIVKNKSRLLRKRSLKDTTEISQSKRQRMSDSPAQKKIEMKALKTGKQKSLDVVKAVVKQSASRNKKNGKRQSSSPRYRSTKIINRSLQSGEQSLLVPKVTLKKFIAKTSQKPKSVVKVLPNRKQSEPRQLKKSLKKASIRTQWKSSSLSSSPAKNISSESFVSVLTRSFESKSSLHKAAPESAVVKKRKKKVSLSPIRKGGNKQSAITKQKKSLTPANKKTSKLSVALRVDKSLSVAANTVIGQSPSSGETDFVQMEKSVTSPSLKRRPALNKRGKNTKPHSHIVKVTPKQFVARKKIKSTSESLLRKLSNTSTRSKENLLSHTTDVTPKQSVTNVQNKSFKGSRTSNRKQSEQFQLKKDSKKVGVHRQKKSSTSSQIRRKISSHSFVRIHPKYVVSEPSSQVSTSRVVTKNIAASPTKKGINKKSTVKRQNNSQNPAKKKTRIISSSVKGLKSLSTAANKGTGPSLSSVERQFGHKRNISLSNSIYSNKSISLANKASPEWSTRKKSDLISSKKLSAKFVARKSQSLKPRRARPRKASANEISIVSPRHKQVTAPLVRRKLSQKATSFAKQKGVGKRSEQSIIVDSTDRANITSYKKTVKVYSHNTSLGVTQPARKNISVSPRHLRKYTNIGMTSPSQLYARTQIPSKVNDINNTSYSKYTAASTREMADTSLVSSKLISSGLGRKSLSPSHLRKSGYAKQGKSMFRDLNIATPSSSAELDVDSYTRYGRNNPSPVISRTESYSYNTSITKKDIAAPSLIEQSTTSLPSWTKDVIDAEHYKNVPTLEVAASRTSLSDDHTRYKLNTPSSLEIKSSTLLGYTKTYGPDVKEISSRQPSFQYRHSVATDLRNIELNRNTFIASSSDRGKVNFVDDDRTEIFGLQAEYEESNGNAETEDIEELEDNEELEEHSDEDIYVKEDGKYDDDIIGSHSTHSQHCTIS